MALAKLGSNPTLLLFLCFEMRLLCPGECRDLLNEHLILHAPDILVATCHLIGWLC